MLLAFPNDPWILLANASKIDVDLPYRQESIEGCNQINPCNSIRSRHWVDYHLQKIELFSRLEEQPYSPWHESISIVSSLLLLSLSLSILWSRWLIYQFTSNLYRDFRPRSVSTANLVLSVRYQSSELINLVVRASPRWKRALNMTIHNFRFTFWVTGQS